MSNIDTRDCECDCEVCERIVELENALESLEENCPGISEMDITIDSSDDSFWNVEEDDQEMRISCGFLTEASFKEIKKALREAYNDLGLGEESDDDGEDEDTDDSGESDYDDLNDEEKIERIQEELGITHPIEILESGYVNAYADTEGNIIITSAALAQCNVDEIAFILAHEDSHVENDDSSRSARFNRIVAEGVVGAWKSGDSLLGKVVRAAVVGGIGIAGKVALNKLVEIRSDIEAQEKIHQAGYDESGSESFFEKNSASGSLSHPASETRRKILEKIRKNREE